MRRRHPSFFKATWIWCVKKEPGCTKDMAGEGLDLLVEDGVCHVFVTDAMADFICHELTRVRHTVVKTEKIDETAFSFTPRLEMIKGTVASVRLDTVLSVAFPMSRSGSPDSSRAQGVCQREADHLQRVPPEGRRHYLGAGMGKFRYEGVLSGTRKEDPMLKSENILD